MGKPRSLSKEPMERFFDKVELTENGCWQWLGTLVRNGYGCFSVRLTQYSAHYFSYLIHKGEVPQGLQLDHLCRNRGCVNPDHLEAVTIKLNVLRGEGIAAINAKKTSCRRSHPYTYTNSRGDRVCSICNRINTQVWRKRKQYVKT